MENVLHQVAISLKEKEYILLPFCPSLQQAERCGGLGEPSPVKHIGENNKRIIFAVEVLYYLLLLFRFEKKEQRLHQHLRTGNHPYNNSTWQSIHSLRCPSLQPLPPSAG